MRKKLLDGGKAAVDASTDPLIVLARDVYPMRRRLAKNFDVEVETPLLKAGDELEKNSLQVVRERRLSRRHLLAAA